MLIHGDHFSKLQSALDIQNKTDGNIHFCCSDGSVEVKSTYFKLHSKLISKIIADVPFDEPKPPASLTTCSKEHTVILPDVPKSYISHLMNLITSGKSTFSVVKLSAIESLSDVINEVLSTADLLNISITNYGLDLEDERVLVPKREQEYCELSEDYVKIETFEEVDLKPNVEDIPLIDAKSVEKETQVIDEILISDDNTTTPSMESTSKEPEPASKEIDKSFLKRCEDYEFKIRSHVGAMWKGRKRQKNPDHIEEPNTKKAKAKHSNTCFICGNKSTSRRTSKQHHFEHWNDLIKKLREPAVLLRCVLCPGKMQYSQNLIGAHILCHHNRKDYLSVPCFHCGELFTDAGVLYRHMKRHIYHSKTPVVEDFKDTDEIVNSDDIPILQDSDKRDTSRLTGEVTVIPDKDLEEGEVSSPSTSYTPSAGCSQYDTNPIKELGKRAHSAHGKLTSGPDAKLIDDKTVNSQQLIAIRLLEQKLSINTNPEKPQDTKKPKIRIKASCICSICGEDYVKTLRLINHQFSEHWSKLDQKLFKHPAEKCALCPQKYTPCLMGAHMLCYHRKRKLSVPCSECGVLFKDVALFYHHMSRHVEEIRARGLQQISTSVTSHSATGGGPVSASANLTSKTPEGLPIPTVGKRSLVKSSSWLGSDLLTSTGQAALTPVFTMPTASSFDLPAPPKTYLISSSSVASTLISNKKTITGEGNSSVTPGWEKELVPKSIFPKSRDPPQNHELVSNMPASLTSDFPFGRPNNQTNVLKKGSDTPVFGKSLSLLKQKSEGSSKSLTNEPSGNQMSPFPFNFYSESQM